MQNLSLFVSIPSTSFAFLGSLSSSLCSDEHCERRLRLHLIQSGRLALADRPLLVALAQIPRPSRYPELFDGPVQPDGGFAAVGFALIGLDPEQRAVLTSLYVEPSCRRRGVATFLFKELKRYLYEQHAVETILFQGQLISHEGFWNSLDEPSRHNVTFQSAPGLDDLAREFLVAGNKVQTIDYPCPHCVPGFITLDVPAQTWHCAHCGLTSSPTQFTPGKPELFGKEEDFLRYLKKEPPEPVQE